MNLATGIKSVIIKPGETIVLPAGSVIKSLIYDGAITATSTCNDLPVPQAYKCYAFEFSANDDINKSPNLEGYATTLNYLEIEGIKYTANINMKEDVFNITALTNKLESFFSGNVPQGAFKFNHLVPDYTGGRWTFYVYFKSIDSIVNTLKLKMSGPGFSNGLFVVPAEATGACI